jgi:hypothetical protein
MLIVRIRRRLRDNGEYVILLQNFLECQRFYDLTAETLLYKAICSETVEICTIYKTEFNDRPAGRLPVALRRHWNNRKCGASELGVRRAKELN